MNKGVLIIISGPSGSGKGTVVKALPPEEGYALSISVTTRTPRAGEVDGRDYFFRTEEEFFQMRDSDELLEHIQFVGNFYGTPRFYMERRINEGKTVVLEIEVNGALRIREKYPDSVLIFLMPPTWDELKRRLIGRGTEDLDTIERRIKRAHDEVKLIEQYDYVVINDEVENAVRRIGTIVAAEQLKPKRSQAAINLFKGVVE